MESLQFTFQEPIPKEKVDKFTQILSKQLRGLNEGPFRFINTASGVPITITVPYDGSHLKAMFIERKISDSLNELFGGLGGGSLMGGLGLFMVNYRRYWVPILVCMIFAGILAYLQVIAAGIDIEGGLFDEEEGGVGAAILNGLVPVLLSAAFMTVMYLLIRKFGMKVIKIFFGVFILFYIWWGTVWYFAIFLYVIRSFQIILDIYFYGSIIGVIILFVQYLRDKLPEKITNALVLLFSGLFGALLGSILPTLSFLFFVGFFAVWDIIAVFKGPLGKIIEFARMESEKTEGTEDTKKQRLQKKSNSDDLGDKGFNYQINSPTASENETVKPTDNDAIGINNNKEFDLSQSEKEHPDDDLDEEALRVKRMEEIKQDRKRAKTMFRDQINIGIGNGDLLFYSAFVVHTIVISQSIITAILVFAAIFLGAKITFDRLLDILIKHELGEEHPGRQLPGLPLSMGFGILAFFLGQGIETLLLLIL